MGRSSGLGGIIEGITGEGGTLTGRGRGIPMPMFPTESVGIMSGSMRKKGKVTRRDERGSRRSGSMIQATMRDPKTGQMYGGLVKDGVPQFKAPDGSTPQGFPAIGASGRGIRQPPPGYKYDEIDRLVPIDTPPIGTPKTLPNISEKLVSRKPEDIRFDPSKPSAVMETERVNVQDPTLGGPPEREVPIPKERDTSPRGRAPFSPDEKAMARDAFFEKMFSRADERKQSRAMDQEERRNVMDARRDEAAMRGSERGRKRGNVNDAIRNPDPRRRSRRRRRDFTRRRSRMEGRRSREERAAFRDQYVSTLR